MKESDLDPLLLLFGPLLYPSAFSSFSAFLASSHIGAILRRRMVIPSCRSLSFSPPFLRLLVWPAGSDYERSEQRLGSGWNDRTQRFSASSILSLCSSKPCARAASQLLTSSCEPNRFEISGRILAVCCSCAFGLSSLVFFHIVVNVRSPTRIEMLILVRTSRNGGYICRFLGLVPLPVLMRKLGHPSPSMYRPASVHALLIFLRISF